MRVEFTPSPELYPFQSRWWEGVVEGVRHRVHYVDEGRGQPVVMLHGNPTWSFLYRKVIIGLRDQFRCIAPDYPGFGLSDRPDGYGYTPAEHAAVVSRLIANLGLAGYLLLGHDWGGPIGIAVALAGPDRVAGLVFGNTGFWFAGPPGWRIAARAAGSAPVRLIIRHTDLFLRLIWWATGQRLSPEERRHYLAVQPNAAARAGLAEFPRQILASEAWRAWLAPEIPLRLGPKPLLLLWGMRDPVLRLSQLLPGWQAAFPHLQLVRLPGAGHFIQEDAPEEIVAAIQGWNRKAALNA